MMSKRVNGGRKLDESKQELISELTRAAGQLKELMKRVELLVDEQHEHARATGDVQEMERLHEAAPYKWCADAKRSMQMGIMFAVRAVVQPTEF